jgi:hypothetical protein
MRKLSGQVLTNLRSWNDLQRKRLLCEMPVYFIFFVCFEASSTKSISVMVLVEFVLEFQESPSRARSSQGRFKYSRPYKSPRQHQKGRQQQMVSHPFTIWATGLDGHGAVPSMGLSKQDNQLVTFSRKLQNCVILSKPNRRQGKCEGTFQQHVG